MKKNQIKQEPVIDREKVRNLLVDIRYEVESSKDLAQEVGEDKSASGSVGYAAGQIFAKLEEVYNKLDDLIDDHFPYEIGDEDDNF